MTVAFPKFRLLDLSVALANNPHTDPPGLGPEIEYADHKQGLPEMLRMFPGLKADDLPDGEASVHQTVTTAAATARTPAIRVCQWSTNSDHVVKCYGSNLRPVQ
jgi:hypothetical protein